MAQAPAPAAIPADETLTGEAVALDVQPLGFFLRVLGALIDMAVAVALFALLMLVSFWLGNAGVLSANAFRVVVISALVLVAVVLPTAVETLTRGRSLGKLAVGGRIVRLDGGAVGFRHAFLRALVGVLEIWLTIGALAALVGAFTPRAQRLGDLIAGTASERTRTPPLPSDVPDIPPALAAWAESADVARLPDRLAVRVSQFVRQAAKLQPGARARLAQDLANDVSGYVSPIPAVDPETLLRGVTAVRRRREWRALMLENQRTDSLLRGTSVSLR